MKDALFDIRTVTVESSQTNAPVSFTSVEDVVHPSYALQSHIEQGARHRRDDSHELIWAFRGKSVESFSDLLNVFDALDEESQTRRQSLVKALDVMGIKNSHDRSEEDLAPPPTFYNWLNKNVLEFFKAMRTVPLLTSILNSRVVNERACAWACPPGAPGPRSLDAHRKRALTRRVVYSSNNRKSLPNKT